MFKLIFDVITKIKATVRHTGSSYLNPLHTNLTFSFLSEISHPFTIIKFTVLIGRKNWTQSPP